MDPPASATMRTCPRPPRILTADRGDAGLRLDLVLRRHLTDVDAATRTRVQAWIENGQVTVNGAPVRRVAARAALGDVVTVDAPPRDAAPRARDGGRRRQRSTSSTKTITCSRSTSPPASSCTRPTSTPPAR